MFDDNNYKYDRTNISHEAELLDGAYLYRLSSLNHCGIDEVLTGAGPLNSSQLGRFNTAHQRATYCANNVLVCMAEILFHMYTTTLNRIEHRYKAGVVRSGTRELRSLIAVKVSQIDNFVYTDSREVSLDFNDARICGTSVVFPAPHYKFLRDFNEVIRQDNKKGAFYPSARHSKDICIVLFHDETSRIDRNSFEMLQVELNLLPEDHDPAQRPEPFVPYDYKIHPTLGHYRFLNCKEFCRLQQAKILNPGDIPREGRIDFVRRRYKTYPDNAVC